MSTLMVLNVKGKTGMYSFRFYGNKKHLKEWASEGLDIIVIENTVPIWIAMLGLTKPYCFLQDCFNFKNPFKK